MSKMSERIAELEAELKESRMCELAALGQAQEAYRKQVELELENKRLKHQLEQEGCIRADLIPTWQPIETYRDEAQSVLVLTDYGDIFEAGKDSKGHWGAPDPRGGGYYCINGKVTHWMPLPKLPSEVKE